VGVAAAEPLSDGELRRAVWFAPPQYTGTCKWMYGCRGLLDETSFRLAAARLIARHESLHAGLWDGDMMGIELLRFLKDITTLHTTFWSAADRWVSELAPRPRKLVSPCMAAARRCASWGLKGSWPRTSQIPLTQAWLDQRVRVMRCRSWDDVDEQANLLRDEFSPPFLMALFLVDTREQPSSYVSFIVSHAFSDGFCSVPLIHDFSSFYAEVEALRRGRMAEAAAARPSALPFGATFTALQDRFFAAIDGQPMWTHPDQVSLRATCFDLPPSRLPWVYNHEVLVESGAVEWLRFSSKRFGVPFDIALLSIVLSATFRARTEVRRAFGGDLDLSLPLTLYAPMRDSDLNDIMIGLFSDWRDMAVSCTEHSTLLGFALDLADSVRQRRWTMFDPIQNSQRILVNILPLDEQPRGPRHFRQTRVHEYHNKRTSPGRRRRDWRDAHRPMRITLEQEALDAWWVSLDLNADHFPTPWCRAFARELRRCLEELAIDPLAKLIPSAEDALREGSGP